MPQILHKHHYVEHTHPTFKAKYATCTVCGWGLPKSEVPTALESWGATCDPSAMPKPGAKPFPALLKGTTSQSDEDKSKKKR